MNYLPGLTSNCDSSDLSLTSSQDYRCDPALIFIFIFGSAGD
jgi:hypothetical protein